MKTVVEKFYSAFNQLDAETMIDCYHEDIQFEDPAFGQLNGDRAKNMWKMLCESQKGKDFKIEFSEIKTNGDSGSAHWEAHYTFSLTGRKIHNKIEAKFKFQDGKIIQHTDHFNLHKWSIQALGLKGFILGWTSFFKKKLNVQTNKLLNKFEKSTNT